MFILRGKPFSWTINRNYYLYLLYLDGEFRGINV